MDPDPAVAPRGRGRPRRTEAERDVTREHILVATAAVFADVGYHATTVTRIAAAAGIAKSHFYKHYPNAAEPLGIVLDRYGEDLLTEVRSGMAAAGGTAEAQTLGAVEGFLRWSTRGRTLLPSFTASRHDPTTPAAAVRERVMTETASLIFEAVDRLGRPRPAEAEIDAFLTVLEQAAYRLHTVTDGGDASLAEARSIMVRAAVAFLGDDRSWRDALDAGLVRHRPGPT